MEPTELTTSARALWQTAVSPGFVRYRLPAASRGRNLSAMRLHTFSRSTVIDVPVERLREWHFEKGAFEKLTPPWERVRALAFPEEIQTGAIAIFEVRIGPFRRKWIARHELTGDGFVDRQIEGPFAFWEHHHRFERVDDSRSRLTDTIRYRLPFGALGTIFGKPIAARKLDRLFRYRHSVTAESVAGKPAAAVGTARNRNPIPRADPRHES